MPPRALRSLLAIGLAVAGDAACRSQIVIEAPLPLRPEDRAVILAVVQGSSVELYAMNAAGEPRVAEILQSGHADLYALLYPRTLAQMRLESGKLRAAEGVAPLRLPQFDAAYSANGTDNLSPWTIVPVVPDLIANFPLAPPDYEGCAVKGGCYVEALDQGVCSVPCPEPTAPAPPLPLEGEAMEAALPILTPCPVGWTEVPAPDTDSPITCEPPARPMVQLCPNGQAQFFGDSACSEVGHPCGPGEYSTAIPGGSTVLYVSEHATPGTGDGSLGAPYGRISDAIGAAMPGTIVAVGQGVFQDTLTIGPGVIVLGACSAQSIVESASNGAAVHGLGPGAALMDVTIHPSGFGVVVIHPGESLDLDGVVIDGGPATGWIAAGGGVSSGRNVVIRHAKSGIRSLSGGHLDADRVVVEQIGGLGMFSDTATGSLSITRAVVRNLSSGASPGAGIIAANKGNVVADQVEIDRASSVGLWAFNGGTLKISNAFVHDTMSDAPAGVPSGFGASVATGSRIELSRSVLERNLYRQLALTGAGTSGTLSDVVVRGTPAISTSSVTLDCAVSIADGATASMHRVLMSDNAEASIITGEGAGAIDFDQVFVRNSRAGPSGVRGAGMLLYKTSSVTMTNVLIDGASFEGLHAASSPGGQSFHIDATDLIVRNIAAEPSSMSYGLGIEIDYGELKGRRIHIERTVGPALAISGGRAELDDLILRHPTPTETPNADHLTQGVAINDGSGFVLRRGTIERGCHDGLYFNNSTATISDVVCKGQGQSGSSLAAVGTTLVADRVTIDETASPHGDCIRIFAGVTTLRDFSLQGGTESCIGFSDRAVATLERVQINDARKAGIEVDPASLGLMLTVTDLAINNVRNGGGNDGVGLKMSAGTATVSRFRISDIFDYGAFVGADGTLVLHDGVIENAASGVAVEHTAFDFLKVFDRVRFRSVGRTFKQ